MSATKSSSLWRMFRADVQASGLDTTRALAELPLLAPLGAVLLHRLARMLRRRGVPLLPTLVGRIGVVLYGAEISSGAELGPGLHLPHPIGVVVGWDVTAGERLTVFQNVTLGGRARSSNGRWGPRIGNDVTIYAGAAVLGPVTVGDGAVIGAHAVVITDVAPRSVVAGNPARPIGDSRSSELD